MPSISLTHRQQQAVETVGCSVIVSAAAGSGKTAVLAQRVAYLVCDAPPEQRCTVDQLLVLTFTDAAAAEMRSRIAEAIRQKVGERPEDESLHEQLALLDTAQISTIHSFCLWLIRRWFNEAGIDPNATVLDNDEATLLKRDVLDALCTRLYATNTGAGDPLGTVVQDRGGPGSTPPGDADSEAPPDNAPPHRASCEGVKSFDELGRAFIELVDDYGLGDDRDVTSLILKLYEFTSSLPDPQGWLHEAVESVARHPQQTVGSLALELAAELPLQADHCDELADTIEAGDPVGHFFAAQIRSYAQQLRLWDGRLGSVKKLSTPARHGSATHGSHRLKTGDTRTSLDHILAEYEAVCQEIAAFEFPKKTGPRLSKDTDPAVCHARDVARDRLSDVKKRLFAGRLRQRFALFSVAELISGLADTAPYVGTIVDTVKLFREAYASRKRQLGVLDFADFERFAFNLLCSKNGAQGPSDVGRALHRRFMHVLVDEFQDINPIQEAIIRLASHESDPDRPNNLFVVGDVKQSIYRFRLAEPGIFTARAQASRDGSGSDAFITLQDNFRSRPEILEAVNVLFRQLMREGSGAIVYTADAELRPGPTDGPDAAHLPVEVHLLERDVGPEDGNDGPAERGVADLQDPSRWTPIEREAFLIGSCIRRWMETGELTPQGRPLQHRDVAVLLRATRINAERMAAILASMGVPAYADVGGSLFGALEIRDVLAALQVFDNFQQDIPLAAVLRSSIMGERLSEDDLVEIRCHSRDIPFHATVREYVGSDTGSPTHKRLAMIVGRIRRYRDDVRCRPLADVLWKLYEQFGYLAYVSGLPNGDQRRANLLKLHELARKFGSFRTQGLHRFLRFVESLEEENRQVASAPAIGESDDVVRIMSVHQSKGLEFPVVFVAGLGTRFNLGDRTGRMIFERESKIGLRVVDTERMIEYATAGHRLIAAEVERSTREEELRILYVAMTRARDKLALVGSRRQVQAYCGKTGAQARGRRQASMLSLATAATPLEWLVPALAAAPVGTVVGLGGNVPDRPLFEVYMHGPGDIGAWRIETTTTPGDKALREAVAHCQPLPADEPLTPDDPDTDRVVARLDFVYPPLASASVRAVIAASEFKGAYDFTSDPQTRADERRLAASVTAARPVPAGAKGAGVQRGIVTHRVLQHLDFAALPDSAGVAPELQRMLRAGILTDEDVSVLDVASIEWFVDTPLAAAIREVGGAYRREFQYIATESSAYFDPSVGSSFDDKVLVRGIVDGILPVADGIEIIDFKTDAVRGEDVEERCERYRPQMELYSRAISRIWRRDVRCCWLVFLGARRTVAIEDTASRGL